MARTDIIAKPGKQEVIVTRILDSPQEEVFRIVTDSKLIPQWWGPERLATLVISMNVTPGGNWRFLQRDKEGKVFGFHGVYHDVVIPERLVYTSEFEGTPGHVSLHTDTFTEQDGKTIMTSIILFDSVEEREQKLEWWMEEGANETTRRLNELLAKVKAEERKEVSMERSTELEHGREDEECITIMRTFDAPREEVWERWTEPNAYMCWWGPKDFTSPYAKFDLRPGGKYLSCMRGPDGKEYWDTGTYQEIAELNRLVYTDSFADEHGNIMPPSYYGMGSDEPIEMAIQVTLEDLGGKTQLTLEHCGGWMIEQAKEGWNQSLDKLAECLR